MHFAAFSPSFCCVEYLYIGDVEANKKNNTLKGADQELWKGVGGIN